MLVSKKPVIRWTEEEWDKLADLVGSMRKNSPDSIASMANRAQAQFPKTRQRPGTLTTATLQPLVDRIQKREREEREAAEKCGKLQAKLTFFENLPETREELLRDLTDAEIQQHFLSRLVQMMTPDDVIKIFSADQLLAGMTTGDLAAVLARRLVERLEEPTHIYVQVPEQKAAAPTNRMRTQVNGKQKKIAVIGIKGDEGRHIRDKVGHLCDLTFYEVEKLREENVPRNVDLIIIWSKFVSHKHRDMVFTAASGRKIDEHFFGTKELIKKIENFCQRSLAHA